MTWLVSASLRLRVMVLAAAAVLVVLGIRVAQDAPHDVFPEFAPPRVEVQTEGPGLSSQEIEALITMPLENALSGTSGLQTMRSKSVLGLSSVILFFERGTDLMTARDLVQERVSHAAAKLPELALPPVILQPLSATSRALKIGLWSETLSQMELSELSKWTIRPRLMAIDGVANVAIWGQRDRQFQVLVDPDRLRAHNVTLDQVETATRAATALGSGGFIDTPNQRLPVRHRSPIVEPEDLAEAVVTFRSGAALLLGDTADVVIGHPPPIGDAIINDEPGILLIVEKLPWGNTLDVTREVEAAMEALRPGLAGVEFDTTIFRPATFIERSLHNLGQTMLLGCGLVVMILVLFLFDWRTACISVVAIPLSVLGAGVVLHLLGGTINTMILAGLVIAIGEVVDDAIIDVENISRRLRDRQEESDSASLFSIVLQASLEVRSAVVIASLIVIAVFLPVFFLDGLAGSFFRPLALAYVVAILASLLVALTVTPALCLMLLPRGKAHRRDAPFVRLLKKIYRRLLPPIVARPRTVIAVLALALTATGIGATKLGEEFLPDFKEYDFLMHWVEKPGTSIEAMTRITVLASKELRAIPGVRNFGSHIGRAEVADEVVGPNFTELWVSVDESADYESTIQRIKDEVEGTPGLKRDVLTYLKERVKEVLSGASATIVVRIFGPELAALRAKAREVERQLADVPGVVDLHVEQQTLVPQIEVRMHAGAAQRFGLSAGDIRRAAVTLIKGRKVGEIYDQQKIYDVTVWGQEPLRASPEALRELLIDTPTGAQVPLGDVAAVTIVPTPNAIQRERASRRIDVMCNVAGRDLGSVARDIEARVAELPFAREYHPEILGEYAARQESERQLLLLTALALLGIVLLLHADFQSWRLTMMVAMSLPFALIGGVAGAAIGGGVISLGSLVGFVTVLGIAARNGIMLISHYRHLQQVEGEPFGVALILRGAEERLSPILMTASCAGLVLLPLVLAPDKPGHEIEHPMAMVILGGLVTSTALSLLFLPALYAVFGRPAER